MRQWKHNICNTVYFTFNEEASWDTSAGDSIWLKLKFPREALRRNFDEMTCVLYLKHVIKSVIINVRARLKVLSPYRKQFYQLIHFLLSFLWRCNRIYWEFVDHRLLIGKTSTVPFTVSSSLCPLNIFVFTARNLCKLVPMTKPMKDVIITARSIYIDPSNKDLLLCCHLILIPMLSFLHINQIKQTVSYSEAW